MTDARLEALLRSLSEGLLRRGWMLATAESCTGGGIAWALTSLPGSSAWFERGFVTYSNQAKREQLGVAGELIERCGAVSEEAAAAMAGGALDHSRAHLAVSVTGIAGPDGGTADKPVGTVCFGWGARGGAVRTTRVCFPGDRRQVRERAVLTALQGALDVAEQAGAGAHNA